MKRITLLTGIILFCTLLLAGCKLKQVELTSMVVGTETLKTLVENPDGIKSARYEKVDKAYLIFDIRPSPISTQHL